MFETMTVKELRSYIKENGIDVKGLYEMKKADLINAIEEDEIGKDNLDKMISEDITDCKHEENFNEEPFGFSPDTFYEEFEKENSRTDYGTPQVIFGKTYKDYVSGTIIPERAIAITLVQVNRRLTKIAIDKELSDIVVDADFIKKLSIRIFNGTCLSCDLEETEFHRSSIQEVDLLTIQKMIKDWLEYNHKHLLNTVYSIDSDSVNEYFTGVSKQSKHESSNKCKCGEKIWKNCPFCHICGEPLMGDESKKSQEKYKSSSIVSVKRVSGKRKNSRPSCPCCGTKSRDNWGFCWVCGQKFEK